MLGLPVLSESDRRPKRPHLRTGFQDTQSLGASQLPRGQTVEKSVVESRPWSHLVAGGPRSRSRSPRCPVRPWVQLACPSGARRHEITYGQSHLGGRTVAPGQEGGPSEGEGSMSGWDWRMGLAGLCGCPRQEGQQPQTESSGQLRLRIRAAQAALERLDCLVVSQGHSQSQQTPSPSSPE